MFSAFFINFIIFVLSATDKTLQSLVSGSMSAIIIIKIIATKTVPHVSELVTNLDPLNTTLW